MSVQHLFATFALGLLVPLSGCWVTEQCSLPGDEDGDGLENCEDPDCALRPYCGGPLREPIAPPGADDDDDDLPFDDDDDVPESFSGNTFSFELIATPADEPGDDDDSASEEGGDDAPVHYEIEMLYTISYWRDLENGIPLCDQVIELFGEAWFGPGVMDELDDVGTCSVCTGFLELNWLTYRDVTNPDTNPDHCDFQDPESMGGADDMGPILLTPRGEGGFGDFLRLALVDDSTLQGLGMQLRVGEAPPIDWAALGMHRTHAAYVQAAPGSMSASLGLDQVTLPPEPGSDYLAAFEIARRDKAGDEPGIALEGMGTGMALFVLN